MKSINPKVNKLFIFYHVLSTFQHATFCIHAYETTLGNAFTSGTTTASPAINKTDTPTIQNTRVEEITSILFQKHHVKSLSINSKMVNHGDAFFALKGLNTDGNDYIIDALNKGAVVVITDDEKSIKIDPDKIIFVKNVQKALYKAIEIFYPKKPRILIAVTGTNGKTSVVSYIAQLYSSLGKKSASIGTIGVQVFECDNSTMKDAPEISNKDELQFTTLDYLSFRKIAYNLTEAGVEYLAFEASSHGLDQGRLGEIKVDVACFTSFSQDHLDYHLNSENYLQAKVKLFTHHLLVDGIAILSSGIKEIEFIRACLNKHNVRFMTVGEKDNGEGNLKITKITSSLHEQNIFFEFGSSNYTFNTSIIGSFQAINLLIAASSVHYTNNTSFTFDKIISVLPKIESVKGRMERVESTGGNIFVDYAHTPDALEKVLKELNSIKLQGAKLVVIFGCGGNRDRIKRNQMGKIAGKLADSVIVTDDNPRLEDPALIRQEIISGIDGGNYIEIGNREEAIKHGVNNLQLNDILVIAGKGHENYQIIGNDEILFSDVEIVKKYTV
ncbi:UDP-N-acetylmuramoyl-L-alanyl-D-glutamate--2,6-diaminopimelate ligase-like [Planococcus citri]|uniref:UDP-N-acetylmuramoylalanyl-D-glutamate 2,6-diaminopimelate ligase n=1 Tax=Planococcus citri TaxID=170843 RepID=S5NFY8_9HEMI|nr:UDP-N-acetylmuramoylalanyl-D-glutamate 2,6-diaminopimelate ligase [Planococcus citri]